MEKNDYCIIATYPSGNEYVVYDELTYQDAHDLINDMNTTKTEDVMYIIGDGIGDLHSWVDNFKKDRH